MIKQPSKLVLGLSLAAAALVCSCSSHSDRPAADTEGIFYWEPEAPAGCNGGYTLGCFDNSMPTVALSPFTQK